jgi:hypothetical protein
MKLNTAEAMAACLFITGYMEEARIMLEPFGYGEEFLRLNEEALAAYCACTTGEEVAAVNQLLLDRVEEKKHFKEAKREQFREGCTTDNSYLADMDLPPMDSDDEYDYDYNDDTTGYTQVEVGDNSGSELKDGVSLLVEGVVQLDVCENEQDDNQSQSVGENETHT